MFRNATVRATRGLITAIIGLFIISGALPAQVTDGGDQDVAGFFRSISGEWIGICEQSTDGEQADNKYFHVTVKETSDNVFSSRFEYYRFDKETGNPLRIGEAAVVTTVAPDGSAKCKINGKGVVLVNEKPKNQEHELTEVLTAVSDGLQGLGTGTVAVYGMPLGLGKNGKVQESRSVWAVKDGVLTISQDIKVGFRALFITKKFDMNAMYTARRGSDIARLMSGTTQVSSKPSSKS